MWYNCLSEALGRIGYRKSIHDPPLLMKNNDNKIAVWCLMYANDILMASLTKEEFKKCISELQKRLTLTIVYDISQFLGTTVKYDMEKGGTHHEGKNT